VLPLLIFGYAAVYAALSWRRFVTFHSQIDMSYYLRLVWGLGHHYYDLPLVKAKSILGLHLEPVLLPFGVLSRLGVPLPPLLLGFQAVAVALLAWPAYRLGARHLGAFPRNGRGPGARKFGGMVAAVTALLYPTVSVASLHDFHPVTLALAPLLATVDALDEGRLWRALLFSLFSLMCREDIALQLFCLFCAYAAPGGTLPKVLSSRWRKLAFSALQLGFLLYFLGYVLWIQPLYVPTTGSYTLHFAKLGSALGTEVHSGRDLVLGLLFHPWKLLALLGDRERLRYLLLLLGSLGFLPLLSPRALAGALPILGLNLLSSFPGVLRLESHYTTALVPFLIAAAICGAGRLRSLLLPAKPPALANALAFVPLVLAVTISHVYHGASPLALRSERFGWQLFFDGKNAAALRQEVAAVPKDASVAARPGPLSHLCERPRALSPPEYDDGQPVDVTLRGE
jgi:uncharacterized membrane protein